MSGLPAYCLARGVDAVGGAHADVHEHDVRFQGVDLLEGGVAVSGRADHVDVVAVVEGELEAGHEDRVVVGQEDADHPSSSARRGGTRSRLNGSTARTTVPVPWLNVTVQEPPSSSARSRIDRSPVPGSTGVVPQPSSVTDTMSDPLAATSMMQVEAEAWRVVFDTASCVIR